MLSNERLTHDNKLLRAENTELKEKLRLLGGRLRTERSEKRQIKKRLRACDFTPREMRHSFRDILDRHPATEIWIEDVEPIAALQLLTYALEPFISRERDLRLQVRCSGLYTACLHQDLRSYHSSPNRNGIARDGERVEIEWYGPQRPVNAVNDVPSG